MTHTFLYFSKIIGKERPCLTILVLNHHWCCVHIGLCIPSCSGCSMAAAAENICASKMNSCLTAQVGRGSRHCTKVLYAMQSSVFSLIHSCETEPSRDAKQGCNKAEWNVQTIRTTGPRRYAFLNTRVILLRLFSFIFK